MARYLRRFAMKAIAPPFKSRITEGRSRIMGPALFSFGDRDLRGEFRAENLPQGVLRLPPPHTPLQGNQKISSS